jgi:uncharacterized protein YkwD
MRTWWLLSSMLVASCTGELRGETSDGGSTDAPSSPGADAPSEDAPRGACEGVSCGAGAVCESASGRCVCGPGFADVGGSCAPSDPGDPSVRTRDAVCALWVEGHRTTATSPWTEGTTECEPGSMSRQALDDTLRRITMFRALVGLPPVTDDPARNAVDQSCANLMYRNGSISHTPPSSWRCYSEAGAMGAASSNLAIGTRDAADAIDLFVGDAGVPSLGHRRWVLNDPLGVVGIGFAGNATCLGVFDGSGAGDRPWTSWPNAGVAPIEGLDGGFSRGVLWSFHSRSLAVQAATVTMQRLSDGAALAVEVSRPGRGYGPDTVAWAPTGWTPTAGERYRVTVNAGGTEITYEVELVRCG